MPEGGAKAKTPTRLLVVMGPAGAGKSTVGAAAAARLRVPFYEGDGFHPPRNIEKIRSGTGLTDRDRRPWIEAIGRRIGAEAPKEAVLACSALNEHVRELMAELIPAELVFVLLEVPEQELLRRLRERRAHFAGPALLRSQLAAQGTTEGLRRLDGMRPAESLAEEAARLFGR